MRLVIFLLLLGVVAGNAFPACADPRTYYVRYAVNMDFLPPLIGERKCICTKPCDIVKLEQFRVILTAPAAAHEHKTGRLVVDCPRRSCALKDGARSVDFRKVRRFVQFKLDDREYPRDGRAVLRSRGKEIGEILLAY